MKHTPQRPFVPTPASNPPIESPGGATFRIAHPFVHGARQARTVTATRKPAETAPLAPAPRSAPPPLPLVYEPPADTPPRSQVATEAEGLAPIEDFLHAGTPAHGEPAGIEDYGYELPPVEHFMDTPSDDLSAAFEGNDDPIARAPGGAQPGETDTSEWSEADWQQFDWRSAAALGDATDPEANSAWRETDWEKTPPKDREGPAETAAKAIADALDGIARRIREGDLSLPSPGSINGPADIAATLAALLGVKR